MELWFDGKSSLTHYFLEMQYCYISTPKRKRHLTDVPAADGNVDVLEGIGEPTYENRTVTALFKMLPVPDDTVTRIINDLEGKTVEIVLPGDLLHYMIGRVHISGAGHKAGEELMITVDCLPWRLARDETVLKVNASETAKQYVWWNRGRRLAVPEITVMGSEVSITANGHGHLLVQGTHLVSELAIPGFGRLAVTTQGGSFSVRYREAIL